MSAIKPELTRRCPLCAGHMKWCGDVPTEVGTAEEMASHTCDQITCTACSFNVEFHDIPEDPPQDDEENGFTRHLQKIADKWNGGETPDAATLLRFVLNEGLPMKRDGRFRVFGQDGWHDNAMDAIRAAIAVPLDKNEGKKQ